MKNSVPYKYINLVLRFTIGLAAVWFIYRKLKDDFIVNTTFLKVEELNYTLISITALLLFVNWGLEAMKWRFSIREIKQITFAKAVKLIFTGITVGFLTPNRIGEIPARALLLGTTKFKELTLKTMVASFSQIVITLLLGGLGLLVTQQDFKLGDNSFVLNALIIMSIAIIIALYFNVKKLVPIFKKINFLRANELIKALINVKFIELLILLGYSFLRYIVFFLQYWLVLTAFGVELNTISEILLIPVCFLLTSLIPTILLSEIGVRGSVALFIFGMVSELNLQIIMSSILLWLINVALPALLGLFNLKELRLVEEK